MKTFPFYKQPDHMDCGPTCLRMVAKYYGKNFSLQKLREISGINKEGISLLGISEAAEKIGFRSIGGKLTLRKLIEIELPLILHWTQNHFVVLYKIKGDIQKTDNSNTYYIADPAKGLIKYNHIEFVKGWISNDFDGQDLCIVLSLSPSPEFYAGEGDKNEGLNWSYLLRYLYRYKQLIIQLFAGLGVGSLLQLIVPFLTQSVVDIGINTRNLNFIYIILIAQTMLFLGRMSVEFIRSWILLHISSRINISILTDFLIKLMKMPMNFFDTKMTGDIMQRMNDQGRIQSFLTGSTLSTIFSMFNLVVFAGVLAYYNLSIFLIFLSVVYFIPYG